MIFFNTPYLTATEPNFPNTYGNYRTTLLTGLFSTEPQRNQKTRNQIAGQVWFADRMKRHIDGKCAKKCSSPLHCGSLASKRRF